VFYEGLVVWIPPTGRRKHAAEGGRGGGSEEGQNGPKYERGPRWAFICTRTNEGGEIQ